MLFAFLPKAPLQGELAAKQTERLYKGEPDLSVMLWHTEKYSFYLIIIYSPHEVNAEYFLSALVFCGKWGTIKETTTNKGAQLWQDRT